MKLQAGKGRRVDLYLTIPQIRELKILSKRKGLTLSDLLRRAVDLYLKEEQRGVI